MDRKIYAKLRDFVATALLQGDDAGLDETTPLLEWGVLDSTAMVDLLAYVERQFGVHIPFEDVKPQHFRTLEALTSLVVEVRGR